MKTDNVDPVCDTSGTQNGVEIEGLIRGLPGGLDRGPPDAEGRNDGPPGAQPMDHMAWDGDDTGRRASEDGHQKVDGVEIEGLVRGFQRGLDRGSPEAEGRDDGPAGAQHMGHIAWGWDNTGRRAKEEMLNESIQ